MSHPDTSSTVATLPRLNGRSEADAVTTVVAIIRLQANQFLTKSDIVDTTVPVDQPSGNRIVMINGIHPALRLERRRWLTVPRGPEVCDATGAPDGPRERLRACIRLEGVVELIDSQIMWPVIVESRFGRSLAMCSHTST